VPTFEFSAYPQALEDFDGGPTKTQRHTIDLPLRDFVTLNIDAVQQGVGGDTSWGALPHFEYVVRPRPLSFSWVLRPFGPGDEPAEELARSTREVSGIDSPAPDLVLRTRADANRVDHLARGKHVTVSSPQTLPWSRAGDDGLVDGVVGSVDYRDGEWRMVEGADFEATIDLGALITVHSARLGFLVRPASAILLPSTVQLFTSADGTDYKPAGRARPTEPAQVEGPTRVVVDLDAGSSLARYLRVKASNIGRCPEGRECAGSPARLAVDEVIVR
jgi:hypothetical protein